MFIREFKKQSRHIRVSKTGKEHAYTREKTCVAMLCDNCNKEFIRERGSMDPKRISNNYFHVCSDCDAKKFAQKKGVERKQIWDMPASSDLPIGKL